MSIILIMGQLGSIPVYLCWLMPPSHKPRLHEHQVPNPDSNLDHNPHGRGGLSLDLNPVCLRVNATNLDQDLDQNPRVNGL